jgi:luciferase family oxidoreductase group 1
MTKISILDFVRITQEVDARGALDNARDLALHAERLGYTRYWVAEHHGYPGIAGGPTAVVLSHVGAGTSSIRIGAGGVMLPNHPPLIVAEQFGALAHLFPGRIDLGLGRSSASSNEQTVRALRRPNAFNGDITEDVLTIQGFFGETGSVGGVQAVPSKAMNVPLWILGTSLNGARFAARMGLPFVFGAHLSPGPLMPAIDAYRAEFKPSAQLAKPYLMVGLNVVAAHTDAKAAHQATTYQMTVTDLVRGRPGVSKPPIDDIETYWSESERHHLLNGLLARMVVGSPSTVREKIGALIAETGADELIIDSDIYSHQQRLTSVEIIAAVLNTINQ